MKMTKLLTASIVLLTGIQASSVALAGDTPTPDGGSYTSEGSVQFKPYKGITEPTDPDEPGIIIQPKEPDGSDPTPGTSGPLSIDYASSISFGTNEVSNRDMTYYANPQKIGTAGEVRANYVQVSDTRGTNAGWTLSLKQEGQLKNETAVNQVLTGSVIKFTGGAVKSASSDTVTPPTATATITLDAAGAESTVMSAANGAGSLTWLDVFGVLEDTEEIDGNDTVTVKKNKAISLFVPGNTPKDSNVKYKTALTWILSEVPGNGSENP